MWTHNINVVPETACFRERSDWKRACNLDGNLKRR